jgi:uncharacterized iron-regulated membrane protein
MVVSSPDSRDSDLLVRRLRRLQVMGVALGSAGGLLFLIGLARRWYWPSTIGLALFGLALVVVLIAGGVAWWKYG